MVVCDLAKVEVAGSNPVSRSIFEGAPTPRASSAPWANAHTAFDAEQFYDDHFAPRVTLLSLIIS